MKLMEIKGPDGSYAGARFSNESKKAIKQYIKENKIPSPARNNSLHTTILYSRKYLPDYTPKGKYDPVIKAKPVGFDIWPSQPDENGNTSNVLVLKLDAPDLVERHKHLMDKHGATFDFDEYVPHVTFSYDVGDTTVDSLPPFEKELELEEEYGEDLNLDWASQNTED